MPRPTSINLHQKSRVLELEYDDGNKFQLPCEYLRVYSPSAEVRGHGVGQSILQTGKKDVAILNMESAGRYALKIIFDDGHDSGLYDWDYLRSLGEHQDELWQAYLQKLQKAGASREAATINIKQL